MPKYLVIHCENCNEPVEAVEVRQRTATNLGEAVNRAVQAKRTISLHDQIDLGRCTCQPTVKEDAVPPTSSERTQPFFRWTIRQLLFITAVVGALTMVFRNPIVVLLGAKNYALAFMPWYFYRWIFFGIQMPAIKRGPPAGVDLFLFCTNFVLAVLAGFYVLRYSYLAIRYGWRKVSQ